MLLEVNALLESGTGGVIRAKDTCNLILIKIWKQYFWCLQVNLNVPGRKSGWLNSAEYIAGGVVEDLQV
jgi:hypothetical protein